MDKGFQRGERREIGRDGTTGMLVGDRALRAREVGKPEPRHDQQAARVLEQLLARATGRRR